jgi:hypothetical protein
VKRLVCLVIPVMVGVQSFDLIQNLNSHISSRPLVGNILVNTNLESVFAIENSNTETSNLLLKLYCHHVDVV